MKRYQFVLLQIIMLLPVLEVRILLLRREAHGGERTTDEVKARAKGIRLAHENVFWARPGTVLRAARRCGRRVPAGVR